MSEVQEELPGGSTEVTKVGGEVMRSRHPGSANVEWLLTELEQRGFRYSPRFRGLSDDDRQVLEFIEGQAGSYPLAAVLRSDQTLISAARALYSLHEATSDLATTVVNGWMLKPVEPYEVICHGDFAPYNCVFTGGRLVGVIDFDTAHPGPRVRDVAYAIYRFAPLTAPENGVGFGSLAEQARRARLFCTEYGEVNRAQLIETACQRLLDLVDYMRSQAAQGDTAFQSHLDNGHDAVYLRDVRYLRTNEEVLTRALM
ncbi:phosphotransferase [Actinomyces naeslundii]